MKYKRKTFLIILIAPSGGGKSTICRKILAKRDDIAYSVSYTTRLPRGKEKNGKDYFFITDEEFQKKIENNDFIEFAKVHNHWYGTSESLIKNILSEGKHAILDIDIQGANKVKSKNIEMISIFLLPPSYAILKNRLRERKTDSEKQIKIRLENAKKEISKCLDYDYLVINEDLEKATERVIEIIDAEYSKSSRYYNVIEQFYQ